VVCEEDYTMNQSQNYWRRFKLHLKSRDGRLG
jgi:hypothetical protein